MDGSPNLEAGSGSNGNNNPLSKLTPADQREVQQTLQSESQKIQIQSTVHNLTERCFSRCVTGTFSGSSGIGGRPKLTSKEETCMENCVGRFMDTHSEMLRHLETLRAGQ